MKDDIMDILRRNRRTGGGPITARELARKVSADPRKVREAISDLRRESVPIASDNRGYWWANNRQELDHTIAHLKSRATKEFEIVRGLEQCFGPVQTRLAL